MSTKPSRKRERSLLGAEQRIDCPYPWEHYNSMTQEQNPTPPQQATHRIPHDFARLWRDPALNELELLYARFLTQSFAPTPMIPMRLALSKAAPKPLTTGGVAKPPALEPSP